MTERDAEGDNPAVVAPTGLEFKTTDTELYVPIVTLSNEYDIKLLEQLKSRLKELYNGINTDHKWLFNLKITI